MILRLAPVAVRVSEQLPIASSGVAPAPNVALQVSAPPLMVTTSVPVGLTAPATSAVTLTETLTDCPGVDGSGVSAVVIVVVLFLAPLNVQGENCETPLFSTQLFVVSEFVLPCRDQPAPPCRQRPRLASELPFNSASR